MNRDQLAAEAEAYRKGLAQGRNEGRAIADAQLDQAYESGREFERGRIRPIEWRKLFTVAVIASIIGCGIILAVAIGISRV